MKKFLAVLMLAAILPGGCSLQEPGGKTDQMTYRQVSMEEAMEIMENETDHVILDVRTQEEYDDGHIPGAVLLPLAEIGSEEISILPDKEQTILVYCRSGNRSKSASDKLAQLGYTGIIEFGGINDWPGEVVTD